MNRHVLTVAVTSALALAACSKRADPSAPAAGAKATPSTAAPSAPEAKPVDPSDPNDLYFVSNRSDVWRVHDGKVTAIKMAERCTSIRAIVQPRDNVPWIDCDYQGYFLIAGDRALVAPRPSGSSSLVRGGDGSLWATAHTPNALFRLEGSAWKNETIPEELREEQQPQFVIDNKGRIYATSKSNIHIRGTDGSWQPFALPPDKLRTYPPNLIADDGGTVFVMLGYKWTEITDGKVGRRRYDNYMHPVPRDGGGILIGNESRVQVIDANGKVERSLSFAKGAVGRRSGEKQTLALDGRGRVYVATAYGLVVIDDKGAVEQWEPGRIDGFNASEITVVAVGGKGPELPALGPRIRGEVIGRVAGMSNATLEMCTGSTGFSTGFGSSFYGATPCAGNPFRFRAKLDGEGRFHFTGVPPLPMSAVVQINSRDWKRRSSHCCSELRAGVPLNIEL